MRWSLRIGRLFGIDLQVHVTFFLLVAWVALSSYGAAGRIGDAVVGVGLTLAVFGSVILHELGHALTARRFGVGTRDIILLPIGGVARLERMPERPSQELIVAAAGPLVSLALWLGFLAIGRIIGGPPTAGPFGGLPLFAQLAQINLALALFNLIPAFPMDGGRMLRAVLAWRGDFLRATRIAAAIGQAMAVGLGFLGLFSNPILVLVALFVWIGATGEARAIEGRALLDGLPVTAAMMTEFTTLSPDDTLDHAAQQLLRGAQTDFPVVDQRGEVTGVLTRDRLVEGLKRQGPETLVGAAMASGSLSVAPSASLQEVAQQMQASRCPVVPVVDRGRLRGLVTLENLGEVMVLRRVVPGWHTPAREPVPFNRTA
jgi:stage IV sporulation protein FB